MKNGIRNAGGAAIIALTLGACGGSSDDPPPPVSSTPPPPQTNLFTKSAVWNFALPPAGETLCYDFDAAAEVAGCTGNAWDLKVQGGGRSASLWTNSGVSGSGQGGAFGGPFDHTWTELGAWTDATVDPVDGPMPAAVYFKDSSDGVFTGTNAVGVAAFEYGVAGDHLFYPNYRVFLITTDSSSPDAVGTATNPVFALQMTGYYGGASGTASGHPSFRWVNRADDPSTPPRTASVDASDASAWVYFDLVTGTVSSEAGQWQIAFNRYNVKLNGGDSGAGKVAGFVGKQPAGFYDAEGGIIAARFTSALPSETLADLTAADMAVPAAPAQWKSDALSSELGPQYRGAYPDPLDFGWYRYFPPAAAAQSAGLPPTAHLLAANPDAATLLRSGEGNSYARMHVTAISYADPNNSASQQTWTIAFDVQPAAQ